jgi:predicted esterase YcpF (UPF0227 family)
MYSIGEIIDKLIIENIKIFNLRQTLFEKENSDKKYIFTQNKMDIINTNRSTIIQFLDKKIEDVINGERNCYFKDIKTYYDEEEQDL